MPQISQVRSKGQFTRGEIKKVARPAMARDDLREAFAGDENKGPSGMKLRDHSTNVKSRKTAKSKDRTPKR